MKCDYTVTFEFNERQPQTFKGDIEATSIRTIGARAIDEALKQKDSVRNWSSVCILLDRYKYMGPSNEDTD